MLAPPWKGGPALPSVRALCWPCSGKAQGPGEEPPRTQPPPYKCSLGTDGTGILQEAPLLSNLQRSHADDTPALQEMPILLRGKAPHGASCCPSDSGQGGPALGSDLPMGLLQEVPRERKTTAPGKAQPALLSASVELPGSPAVT